MKSQRWRSSATTTCDALISEPSIYAHRRRGLTPDQPVLRGTAQNPDVFFQAREAANVFYDACPAIVERTMRSFAELTGRRYGLFEHVGDPNADARDRADGVGRGNGARSSRRHLTARGEKVGVLKVAAVSPVLAQRVPSHVARRALAAWLCSIGRRSRARRAIRSTWT